MSRRNAPAQWQLKSMTACCLVLLNSLESPGLQMHLPSGGIVALGVVMLHFVFRARTVCQKYHLHVHNQVKMANRIVIS